LDEGRVHEPIAVRAGGRRSSDSRSDGDRRPRHAHNVMLEAFSAGRLDIGERELNPRALVQGALSVDLPARAFIPDHDRSIADKRHTPETRPE
jgi:hypothetical protein